MADMHEAVEKKAIAPKSQEINFEAIVLTDSQGDEVIISAGRIPDTETTLLHSLPFVNSRSKQLSVRMGTFMGVIPDKTDSGWKAFEQAAVRLARSGQIVTVEKFSERATQMVRDEQQCARQMPRH